MKKPLTAPCSFQGPHPRSGINQMVHLAFDNTYTGQTGRLLGKRLKKHRSSVRRHDPNSCLELHCMDTVLTFNWHDTSIFGSANSLRTRKVLKSGEARRRAIQRSGRSVYSSLRCNILKPRIARFPATLRVPVAEFTRGGLSRHHQSSWPHHEPRHPRLDGPVRAQ